MKKEKFDIGGMTCASCVAHVEKAAKSLNGVENVSVNLLLNNMTLEYDEALVSAGSIIKAVNDAGYSASLYSKKASSERKNVASKLEDSKDLKHMKKRLIISICFLAILMLVSMGHMMPLPNSLKEVIYKTSNAGILVFAEILLLIPIVYLNRSYFILGFKRLFKLSPNMDSLIGVGSSASILHGIFSASMIFYALGHGDYAFAEKYINSTYFESAGMILTLITLGKYLEARSKAKTTDAIKSLINLMPKTAVVIKGGKEEEIMTEDIILGDILVIKPGASVPVDGVVIEGSSYIDQSAVTGESVPVFKNTQDKVISGTINKNGYIKIKATKVGEDTTLSQIIKLVEEASSSKANVSKLADRVSAWFVPCIILISVITFIVWMIVSKDFELAFNFAISVLVISCPCALGLATPVAIMVASGKGASNGILIKSAESLETLCSVNAVILDKTGTITEGNMSVADLESFEDVDENELAKIAASLENKAEHPIAEAITDFASKKSLDLYEVDDFKFELGRGVSGKINGTLYFAGNLDFVSSVLNDEKAIKKEDILFSGIDKTYVHVSSIEKLIGAIAVSDTIKQGSKAAINELKKRNIDVYMVTGDSQNVANAIGKELNIENIISEVLPQEKEKVVEKLQASGKVVAFVGDGINDSPALVKSDVGIAIGAGTDIAAESADIVLMKNSLTQVINAADLSKLTIRNIKQNLFWAFFYNVLMIPVAGGVFYAGLGLKLNPMIGALAMSLSSVCVVTNALRINKFKSKYGEEEKMESKIKEKIVYIDGMQCNHCKMSVEKALSALDGVAKVSVSLEDKTARIKLNKDIEDEKIVTVIKDAGFTAKDIK